MRAVTGSKGPHKNVNTSLWVCVPPTTVLEVCRGPHTSRGLLKVNVAFRVHSSANEGPHTIETIMCWRVLLGGFALHDTQKDEEGKQMENMFSRCFCVKLSARFSEEVDFKQTYLGDGGRGHRSFLCLKFQTFSHLPIWR